MSGTTIVWLRDDLRLADNPALTAAAERGEPVVLVYLLDEVSPGIRPLGAASRWWLHHSLAALSASVGGQLVLRRGAAEQVIPALVAETDAAAVHWNRRYSASRDIDARLAPDASVSLRNTNRHLLREVGRRVPDIDLRARDVMRASIERDAFRQPRQRMFRRGIGR